MKIFLYFSSQNYQLMGGFKIKVFIFANKFKFKNRDYVRHCIKS